MLLLGTCRRCFPRGICAESRGLNTLTMTSCMLPLPAARASVMSKLKRSYLQQCRNVTEVLCNAISPAEVYYMRLILISTDPVKIYLKSYTAGM